MSNDVTVRVPTGRRRLMWLVMVLLVIAALCSAAVYWRLNARPALPDGLSPEEYAVAAAVVSGTTGQTPDHFDALMVAAEQADGRGDLETAVAAFSGVPDQHLRHGAVARLREGELLVRLNQAIRAEDRFRRFLKLAENNLKVSARDISVAEKWLSFLLSVELRLDERRLILQAAHRAGRIDLADSKQYFFPRLLIWKSSTGRTRLNDFLETDPHSLILNVADGRYLTGEGRLSEARELLAALRHQFPNDLNCAVAFLECCFEQNDWASVTQTLQTMPPYRLHEPHVITWIRGEAALHDEHWEDAVRHFEAALQSDASNPAVHMGLAKALGKLGQTQQQQVVRDRSLLLSRIRVEMARVRDTAPDEVRTLADRCRQLEMDEAATVFQWHADRLKQKQAPK
ncbi:MAG: hypothetical protein RIK87_23820 [Fuerstiella sp.]